MSSEKESGSTFNEISTPVSDGIAFLKYNVEINRYKDSLKNNIAQMEQFLMSLNPDLPDSSYSQDEHEDQVSLSNLSKSR